MGRNTRVILYLIAAIIFIISAAIFGRIFGHCERDVAFRPQILSYQQQIDSLRFRLDTALAHIDLQFAPKERIIIKYKEKLIIQKQENDIQEFFALDTAGRVDYFRKRVLAICPN